MSVVEALREEWTLSEVCNLLIQYSSSMYMALLEFLPILASDHSSYGTA